MRTTLKSGAYKKEMITHYVCLLTSVFLTTSRRCITMNARSIISALVSILNFCVCFGQYHMLGRIECLTTSVREQQKKLTNRKKIPAISCCFLHWKMFTIYNHALEVFKVVFYCQEGLSTMDFWLYKATCQLSTVHLEANSKYRSPSL